MSPQVLSQVNRLPFCLIIGGKLDLVGHKDVIPNPVQPRNSVPILQAAPLKLNELVRLDSPLPESFPCIIIHKHLRVSNICPAKIQKLEIHVAIAAWD